ncbi:MAG: NAD(P)/FAD-dependent oxidoreductase [Betaproteobacteria bacterium]|nr:NAD(P)/FAD-dependent oxidoreductase [Betaproteobacteria bacterium]
MAQGKTVLVLGGGIGGTVAATRLRKMLPDAHRVVMIEREPQHVFAPSYLWVMVGQRSADRISRPMATMAKRGIELVQGVVEEIDPARRAVRVDGKELAADYVIVALGADLAPEAIPGLESAGHNFYTLDGAESLREARLKVRSGRVVVLVSALPFKCPGAPNEAAMLLEYDYRKRGVRDRIQIDLYTAEPGPMPVAGPVVSNALRQMIEAKGIGYHPNHAATAVDPVQRRISFANGTTAEFDLLAYIPPHRAPQVVRDAGMCGDSGWVPVDRGTMETKFHGVFAIGDVAGIMLSSIGKPLPKAGVFAHNEAEVVANNIALAITGKGAKHSFTGEGECFIETGDRRAAFGSGNFYAEPAPDVKLKEPSVMLHVGKVAYEKYWLLQWF